MLRYVRTVGEMPPLCDTSIQTMFYTSNTILFNAITYKRLPMGVVMNTLHGSLPFIRSLRAPGCSIWSKFRRVTRRINLNELDWRAFSRTKSTPNITGPSTEQSNTSDCTTLFSIGFTCTRSYKTYVRIDNWVSTIYRRGIQFNNFQFQVLRLMVIHDRKAYKYNRIEKRIIINRFNIGTLIKSLIRFIYKYIYTDI